MRFSMLTIALAAIITTAAPQLAGQATATSPGSGRAARAPIPPVVLQGVLYDAGGMWVTDFVLPSGAIVTVPHDPSLGDLIFVTVPPGSPFFISLSTLKDWTDNDGVSIPAIAGSGQCWLIPYGPPDPDGTLPFQPTPTTFTGSGGSLSAAVADYKKQVEVAIEDGAVPSPGSC